MSRYRDELPPRVGPNAKLDWASACEAARKRPNTWYLAFKKATTDAARTVRRKRANALRVEDGEFRASMRNTRKGVGELWLMFVPADPDTDIAIMAKMKADGDL
jgi:hypothetical protein